MLAACGLTPGQAFVLTNRVDNVQKQRPVNLDLTAFKFPVTAISSIIHRITGVILFVGVALLLAALDQSLTSEQSFNALKECLANPLVKLITWGVVSALLYHLVAGIRHMLMDLGIGESLESGILGAKAVIGISVVLIILAGVAIW